MCVVCCVYTCDDVQLGTSRRKLHTMYICMSSASEGNFSIHVFKEPFHT